MERDALIVFVKNPVPGTVKTRLARTIGDAEATRIYERLLQHTLLITQPVQVEKYVYYADFLPAEDLWSRAGYQQRLQQGGDLGQKILHAFSGVLGDGGHRTAVIIGSDCMDIAPSHIHEAFLLLQRQEVVIGPARDGGYYLLGMQRLLPFLFQDKSWSTPQLLQQTLHALDTAGVSYALLEELSDIDEAKDLYLLNRP